MGSNGQSLDWQEKRIISVAQKNKKRLKPLWIILKLYLLLVETRDIWFQYLEVKPNPSPLPPI